MSRVFPAGRIVPSPAALAAMDHDSRTLADLLARHLAGEWGDVGAIAWLANDAALQYGRPLCSCYRLANGHRIIIRTAADRSCTTVAVQGGTL